MIYNPLKTKISYNNKRNCSRSTILETAEVCDGCWQIYIHFDMTFNMTFFCGFDEKLSRIIFRFRFVFWQRLGDLTLFIYLTKALIIDVWMKVPLGHGYKQTIDYKTWLSFEGENFCFRCYDERHINLHKRKCSKWFRT